MDQQKIWKGVEAEKVITKNKLLFARFWQKEDVNCKQLVTSWCNSKTAEADCRQYKVDDRRDAADFLNTSGCHLLTDHLFKTLLVKSDILVYIGTQEGIHYWLLLLISVLALSFSQTEF